MYSEPPNSKVYSAPGHHRSKTRTLHLSEKPLSGLFMSQEIEKIERESLSRRIGFLSEENLRLKEQMNAFEGEYEKLLKEKSDELEAFQLERLDGEMTVKAIKDKYEELLIELNERKEENARLSNENEVLLEKIEFLSRGHEKLKVNNNAMVAKLERIQSNSVNINKEFENKHQKAQEGYSKKLSDLKAVYKKKLRTLKNELKVMKSLSKELELSEQKRLEALQEFEAFKGKSKEETTSLLQENDEQMRRLEENCELKLTELEQQLEQRLRSENDSFGSKFRNLQQENRELSEKLQEKERFLLRTKEDAEKDAEALQKSLETLQKANELQRRKVVEQQEKFLKELERKQKEIEQLKQETEGFRQETEEKNRLSREELHRLVQRLQEKQQEIANLRGLLSQKMVELDSNFVNNQTFQAKVSENRQLSFEKETLSAENAAQSKMIEGLRNNVRELEAKIKEKEGSWKEDKEKMAKILKENEEKNMNIAGLQQVITSNEVKINKFKEELKAYDDGVKGLKTLETERNQAVSRIQELQQTLKAQERRYKDEVNGLNRDFDGKIEAKAGKIRDLENKLQGFEHKDRETRVILNEKDSKIKNLSMKCQSIKERSLGVLKLVKGSLKELRSVFASLNQGVLIETLGLEIQEKLIAFSGVFTRKMAAERNRIESFFTEERNRMKDKHQRDLDEFIAKIREKDQKLQRNSEEKARKDQSSIRELETGNREMSNELNKVNSELNRVKGALKDREKELERLSKSEGEVKELRRTIERVEELRAKEKEKACKDLLNLRGEIDELYQRNKLVFDEFTVNIAALKENQEQELKNINASYDEIIEVLKEKVQFYEENGQMLTQDYSEKYEGLEKQNQELENQAKALKAFYEEQIALIENKHSQVLFQNTMEADKNLRNLGIKAQEVERLELKIRDLEGLLRQKAVQIEELASKNSSIEGKLRNLQFQLELKTNHLNLNPVQISEELYKEELLENPILMPSTSYKSKHYSKASGLNLNLPATAAGSSNHVGENQSDIFNKRINELKHLSQSISTNPLNTYKELPGPGEEERRGGDAEGGTINGVNLHRYSKSSSNFLQYANKLVEKTNNNGFTSHRDQRERMKSAEKKANMHRNNQKSSLI